MYISESVEHEMNELVLLLGFSTSVIVISVTLTQSVIKTSLSVVNMTEITITDIDNPNNSTNPFISCSTDSEIYINGLDYLQSEASLILLNNVTGIIDELSIVSSRSISNMIQIDGSYELVLMSVSIKNVSSHVESIILIKNNVDLQIDNITVSNVLQLVTELSNSHINRAYNMTFTN